MNSDTPETIARAWLFTWSTPGPALPTDRSSYCMLARTVTITLVHLSYLSVCVVIIACFSTQRFSRTLTKLSLTDECARPERIVFLLRVVREPRTVRNVVAVVNDTVSVYLSSATRNTTTVGGGVDHEPSTCHKYVTQSIPLACERWKQGPETVSLSRKPSRSLRCAVDI